jgi:hypothetical protein
VEQAWQRPEHPPLPLDLGLRAAGFNRINRRQNGQWGENRLEVGSLSAMSPEIGLI